MTKEERNRRIWESAVTLKGLCRGFRCDECCLGVKEDGVWLCRISDGGAKSTWALWEKGEHDDR